MKKESRPLEGKKSTENTYAANKKTAETHHF